MIHLKYPKPDGAFIWTSELGEKHSDSKQCMHCGCHWEVKPFFQGIRRGWCTKCLGPVCGAKDCEPCIPIEKRLENIERAALSIKI